MGSQLPLLVVLFGAHLRLGIVEAAIQRYPIRFRVLAPWQVVRLGITRNGTACLPDNVELAVRLHFADVDRLGDVVVRQDLRHADR